MKRNVECTFPSLNGLLVQNSGTCNSTFSCLKPHCSQICKKLFYYNTDAHSQHCLFPDWKHPHSLFSPFLYSGNCPIKFVWDYGGREAYVCVFQNGSQLTIPMKRSNDDKYLEADAKLTPGRCEFRWDLIPLIKNTKALWSISFQCPKSLRLNPY